MSSSKGLPKIKPLSNSNYPEWSGEMRAWLMRNGLWRLVSGKLPKPIREADEILKWETKAEKVAGEIYLLVENDQRVHFRGKEDDPIEMWKLLEAAHLSKKPGARFNAYDDLFSIRKQDSESLVDVGVRLEKAMQAIQNLRPANFTIEQLDEELQCMALIRALPDEYRHLSSNLLLVEKLDKAMILQAFRSEELNRQRGAQVAEMLNKVQAMRRGGRSFADTICFFCQNKGHMKQNCSKFKAWWLENNKGRGASGQPEGAKKAEGEKAAVVTEFAGQASTVDNFALTTLSNIFHWNADTGATSHMTPHRLWIRNYVPYKVPIRLADNSVIYSEGMGSVLFQPLINGQLVRNVEFTRVLHVPGLQSNLLSVLYLTKHKGFSVHISSDTMKFERNTTVWFTASINNDNVAFLNGSTINLNKSVHLVSMLPLDLSLWHKRLGHHNYDDIQFMLRNNLVVGLVLDSKVKPDPICEPCLAGKMHANPFLSSDNRATELLELIHSDVYDAGHISHGGYRYWALFIDDYSRKNFAMPLKRKSDTLGAFKTFKAYAEKQTGKLVKGLRDDKGGEYMSNEFDAYLKECGISRQHSVRNRPQQNGVAERTNRTLRERITALLSEAGLSKAYWAECLASLVHVLDRCPTAAVHGSTPFERWFGKKPDVGHLRVWGCLAYVHIQRDKRSKFASHMEKCIFIGYPEGYKGLSSTILKQRKW